MTHSRLSGHIVMGFFKCPCQIKSLDYTGFVLVGDYGIWD